MKQQSPPLIPPSGQSSPSRAERVFRRLLRLFPFEFQRDYGRDMTLTFRDQCEDTAEEGRLGWLRLWWETVLGIFKTAPGEHLAMLRQDLAYALRALRKNAVFTTVALITLALGIGVNSAIFSLVDGVLLSPLALPEPERLVWFWTTRPEDDAVSVASLHDFEDWQAESTSFEHLAVFSPRDGNLNGDGLAERIEFALVSTDFFAAAGIEPILGRAFAADEDLPGNDRVAVLAHGFWKSHLGGDRDVLGKTVELNGQALTIVGVMPPGIEILPGLDPQLWKPLGMTAEQSGNRDGRWIPAIGRLRDGVALGTAQAEMDGISERLAEAYPTTNEGWQVRLEPLGSRATMDVRSPLLLLWAAVGVVLLIVCANLANLLLARGTARRQEIALRSVLGAGRPRIIRQLLSESLVLSLGGGLLGLTLAHAVVRLLPVLAGDQIPRIEEVGIDVRILGFTLVLSLATGLVFGLAPALKISKSDLNVALKDADRSGSPAGSGGLRGSLVVAEVALAVVVLVTAGLLVRSFAGLLRVEPGFATEHVVSLRVAPPWRFEITEDIEASMRRMTEDRGRVSDFYRRLLERLETIPGIDRVSAVSQRPLSGANSWVSDFRIEGRAADEEEVMANVRSVMPGYFETLEIPLLRGRYPTSADSGASPRVAVISRSMAERYWGDADPIGQRVAMGDDPEWSTIVGVVGDVQDGRLEWAPNAMFYWPLAQARWGHFMDWGMDLVIRGDQEGETLVAAVRREVRALEPSLPVFDSRTMEDAISGDLARRRFHVTLLGAFAALALVLTAVGIYGVMAYSVGLRKHEMGVRLALGSSLAGIVSLVLRQGMVLVAVGLVLGTAGALAVTRTFQSLLYGVGASDPMTFVLVGGVLLAAAWLACLVPARRATRVDPIQALRYE